VTAVEGSERGEWSEPLVEEPRRRARWPWYLGGGCALGCLVAVVVGIFAFSAAADLWERSLDPEVAWERLDEILPHEQRPEALEPVFSLDLFGMSDTLTFADGRTGLIAVLVHDAEGDAEGRERLMDPERTTGVAGVGGLRDAVAGTLVVQGREVAAMRGAGRAVAGDAATSQLWVDLSEEGGRFLVLMLLLEGADREVPEGAVEVFLEPFDVWGER
jgi:hypothetical protein